MKRIITWFVTNSVATNLLVGFAVIAGVAAFSQIPIRAYPDFDLPIVSITVPYLGAAPEEVERGVCTRIEDQVDGVVGIQEVLSTADEGICTVRVELFQDADRTQALNDIRNRVNAIETFPAEAEAPLVRLLEVPPVVIEVAVTGPTDERLLKQAAREVRANILALPGITQASVASVRPYEIAIEVSEDSLLRNDLTFDQVAAAVSRNSVDLPGGTIKAEQGQVLLRTKGQAYSADELKRIIVKARPDGGRVLLEDVATVIDGFEDTGQRFVFDGSPAALVQVSRVGDQDIRQIADAVREYVEDSGTRHEGGEAVRLTVWNDQSSMLRDRLGALMGSGIGGLLLVLVILALFLRPSVAIWVAVGIPIALLGATFLLFVVGVSINLYSIIGFILVLGMLVDDAVVVGEAAYVSHRTGGGPACRRDRRHRAGAGACVLRRLDHGGSVPADAVRDRHRRHGAGQRRRGCHLLPRTVLGGVPVRVAGTLGAPVRLAALRRVRHGARQHPRARRVYARAEPTLRGRSRHRRRGIGVGSAALGGPAARGRRLHPHPSALRAGVRRVRRGQLPTHRASDT